MGNSAGWYGNARCCPAGASKGADDAAERLIDSPRWTEQRRLPFSRAAAIAFVESCWELIDDDPDVWYWSDRFAEAQPASGKAPPCIQGCAPAGWGKP